MKKNAAIILLIVFLSLLILIGGILLVVILDINSSFSHDIKTNNSSQEIEEVYKFTLNDSAVTNIKDSKKYVRCKLVIELGDFQESNQLENDSYKVRDIIIKILRSFGEKEYMKESIQEQIEKKIKKTLENNLDIKSIKKVYFNEFVTQ